MTAIANVGASAVAQPPRYRTVEEANQALRGLNQAMSQARSAGGRERVRVSMEQMAARSEIRMTVARLQGPPPRGSAPAEKLPASEDRSVDLTTRGGLAYAETARDDIEFLSSMVATYNSAKYRIDNPQALDAMRARYGDERADMVLESARRSLEGAQQHLKGIQQRWAQLFKVSGVLTAVDDKGRLTLGDFTLSKAQSGWSLKVASDGAAQVWANGVDVSALVDNRKNNGEYWPTPGGAVDIKA